MQMTRIIKTDDATVAVLNLGGKYAVAERRNGSWRVAGSGPAGDGGTWTHASLERLATDVATEQRRFGHVATHPTAMAAAESVGVSLVEATGITAWLEAAVPVEERRPLTTREVAEYDQALCGAGGDRDLLEAAGGERAVSEYTQRWSDGAAAVAS